MKFLAARVGFDEFVRKTGRGGAGTRIATFTVEGDAGEAGGDNGRRAREWVEKFARGQTRRRAFAFIMSAVRKL